MRKYAEVSSPASCLNRAVEHEMIFVLLGRDAAAPDTIRYWVAVRIEQGKNKLDDLQIVEALKCADMMEQERAVPHD